MTTTHQGYLVLILSAQRATFLIFASACFAAYVWATYWVPETANVSLEDIDTLFGGTAGQEDMRIKHQVCIPFPVKTHFTVDSSTPFPLFLFST